jgi:hypothetical protein
MLGLSRNKKNAIETQFQVNAFCSFNLTQCRKNAFLWVMEIETLRIISAVVVLLSLVMTKKTEKNNVN